MLLESSAFFRSHTLNSIAVTSWLLNCLNRIEIFKAFQWLRATIGHKGISISPTFRRSHDAIGIAATGFDLARGSRKGEFLRDPKSYQLQF